jgi:hypothetical protein
MSLVAAIIAMAGGPLFAEAAHPMCVARQHDCGNTPAFSKCCCGNQDPTRSESSPVQPRVDAAGADVSATVVSSETVRTPARFAMVRVQTSPPRLCLLDLPTLFATFLI